MVAFGEERPLAFFAGIWTNWTSVRKVKEGETTNDIFAFLTTEPNKEVSSIHPKAMPVILNSQDEIEQWMTAPTDEALKLQRPLPDGALQIVAKRIEKRRLMFLSNDFMSQSTTGQVSPSKWMARMEYLHPYVLLIQASLNVRNHWISRQAEVMNQSTF